MPTYISLANWTERGISDVKQTLERADQNAQLAQKHGCTLERLYWTVGPYDLVAIVEAPDEESAMAYALEVGASGPCGRLRFPPTTTKRCQGSSKDSAEITLSAAPGWGSIRSPGPSLMPLFTEVRGREVLGNWHWAYSREYDTCVTQSDEEGSTPCRQK